MSLSILFHFLCTQHVSDINISIIRSLRLFCWSTKLVLLFLVRCVLEFRCGWFGVVSVVTGFSIYTIYAASGLVPTTLPNEKFCVITCWAPREITSRAVSWRCVVLSMRCTRLSVELHVSTECPKCPSASQQEGCCTALQMSKSRT